VKPVNVFTTELDLRQDREGYSWTAARIGDRLGSELIGATVYELDAGQQTFPFHFHHGIEEWLYVVAGEPTLRTPEGTRTLRPGELICFPEGPDGAHGVRGPGRIVLFSANHRPSVSVYPDSDKLGTRPGVPIDNLNFRRCDAVGYWDGE
jgi:uncharacterized cupin superfamily protein